VPEVEYYYTFKSSHTGSVVFKLGELDDQLHQEILSAVNLPDRGVQVRDGALSSTIQISRSGFSRQSCMNQGYSRGYRIVCLYLIQ